MKPFKLEKRQLVLAALVVALGAAVYLNWQFSQGNEMLAADATASRHDLGEAQLVNAGAASTLSSSATAVSSQTAASSVQDYFSQARLDRQKARDSATELLQKTLEDSDASDAAKKEALQKAAAIAGAKVKENNAENLIKAKGFADCVVFLQDNACSVVVKPGGQDLNQSAVVIKDIVTSQCGVSYEQVKIIEQK